MRWFPSWAVVNLLLAATCFSADPPAKPEFRVTPAAEAKLGSFDRMMKTFLVENELPGAAIAVTDHGRLVFARGYGYTDLETKEPVTATSLFRIASLSKPITAVAVLQLAERGRIGLDDHVFEILPHKPASSPKQPFDERHQQITVRHLLQHRGGWDREQSFDPMFRSVSFAKEVGKEPPASTDDIIRCMLGRKLDFDPGQRYAYSNYGYCLLGRVIEAATGESYEQYVRREVLLPLGIRTMRLGRTLPDERGEHEVHYYDAGSGHSVFPDNLDQKVPSPYGAWCLEAMDAHGGWLASAVDLAKFACAFDYPDKCPVLSRESIREMFARPPGRAGCELDGDPKPVYYGCGWQVRVVSPGKRNHWHTGSLPGTASLMVRRHDGRNWIVLFNQRSTPDGQLVIGEIDRLLHRAADAVETWPRYDLFE